PKNVRVGERSSRPLQRVHLEIAFEHVRVHRRKFVGSNVELDADRAQILLNDRRLQPIELESVRDLQAQPQPGRGPIAVRVAVTSLVKERAGASGIVGERKHVGSKRPRQGGKETGGWRGEPTSEVLDDGAAGDGARESLT